MTSGDLTNLILALGALITAVGTAWANIQSNRRVETNVQEVKKNVLEVKEQTNGSATEAKKEIKGLTSKVTELHKTIADERLRAQKRKQQ